MSQTTEAANTEAIEAIRTVAPQAVEALRLSSERYLLLVPKLAKLAAEVKAARAPILAEAKTDQKTLRGLVKQWGALKEVDDAETYKTLAIQMSKLGASIKAVKGRADADSEVMRLTTDQEATRDRIAEIDGKMPAMLADAFIRSLVAS